ncbi:MAG: NAD(P)-dependent oxidoreductase [Thermoprotei archaeon]|nr:MAG: NAD(P)-dependent oxidoreductase [Thermoprotei archaeon]
MIIGIIGTGLMGSSLTKCLVNRGYNVIVYNRSCWKAEKLREQLGVKVADNPKELLDRTKVAIAFISGDNALCDVVFGDNGVSMASKGSIFINASTVTPMASLRVYKHLKRHNIFYLEAPVYGSTSEAIECRLLSIVAGKEDVYKEVHDLLKDYSSKIYYVGEIPRASVIKLALNNIGLALPALLAESLLLLKAWNVDPEVFHEIAGNLWFKKSIERYWNRIVVEKSPQFKVWMAGKDYWYIAQSLKAKRLPSNLCETLSSMYMQAAVNGFMDKDYPLIAKYYMTLIKNIR